MNPGFLGKDDASVHIGEQLLTAPRFCRSYHIIDSILTESVESFGQLDDLRNRLRRVGLDVLAGWLTLCIYMRFEPCLQT
jgi:hypothetical protein